VLNHIVVINHIILVGCMLYAQKEEVVLTKEDINY
jgi:hypothetical protein